MTRGAETAGVAGGRPIPTSNPRTTQYIRELQLLVGKQAVELEVLRAEFDALKKGRRTRGAPRR